MLDRDSMPSAAKIASENGEEKQPDTKSIFETKFG